MRRLQSEHRTPNTEHRTPNTEHRTPNTEHRTPNTEHRTPNTEPQLFARIKSWAKKQPLLYCSVHHLREALYPIKAFTRWQCCKFFTRFNRSGLNTTEPRTQKLIVSLTSYPARINIVPYVIASLLRQTLKPDKIILWLGKEKFPDEKLPPVFDKLKACGVDIEFREDIGPLTKYFYAPQEYPDDIIITFDDDLIYDDFIIETLYKSYLEHPDCVSAMRVHKIRFTQDGSISNYNDWEKEYSNAEGIESHVWLATGVGGVLYPPHCLHSEAFNLEAIRKFSLVTDDLWWKVMEVMNDTKVVPASNESKVFGWTIINSQATAMWRINIIHGNNDREIKIMLELYSGWRNKDGRTLLEVIREG